MPLTRFKLTAIGDGGITNAKLSDDAVNTDELADNIEISGTEAARMPVGTTAQRTSAQSGDIRFNSDLNLMEYYDGTIWKAIDSPPVVSSISPASIANSDSSVDIVITGSNFQSGATVKAVGTDNSQINATTVTVTSSTQVTANFDGTSFSDALENYDIVLTNSSGLAGTLAESLAVNASPVWTTAASPTTLATVNDGDTVSGSTIQVAATDVEGESLTYSLSSGSLPAGLSVQTDGTITGTVTEGAGTWASGGETYTPTLSVTDGTNTINRTFAIVKKWYDGSTQALAAPSGVYIADLTSTTTDGNFWIKPAGESTAIECFVLMQNASFGRGAVLAAVFSESHPGFTMSGNTGGLDASNLKNYSQTAVGNNSTRLLPKSFINNLVKEKTGNHTYGGFLSRENSTDAIALQLRKIGESAKGTVGATYDPYVYVYNTGSSNNNVEMRITTFNDGNSISAYKSASFTFSSYATYTGGRAGGDNQNNYHYIPDDHFTGGEWMFRENNDNTPRAATGNGTMSMLYIW